MSGLLCVILSEGSSPYNDSTYSHDGPSPVSAGFPVSTAIGQSQGGMLQVVILTPKVS